MIWEYFQRSVTPKKSGKYVPNPEKTRVMLRKVRLERGLTQKQVAASIGYTSTHIVSIEKGRRPLLLWQVGPICRALGIKDGELL